MAVVFLYLDPDADRREGRQHYEFRRLATSDENRRGDYGLRDRYSAESHQFSTGSEIMRIIGGYDVIHRLVIFAHGGPSWIGWANSETNIGGGIANQRRRQGSWVWVGDFCRLLAPKLAPNTLIALAACSCAKSPRDWARDRDWRASTSNRGSTYDIENRWRTQWASNGIGSIASEIRDGCVEHGAQGVVVRGHLNPGHATHNPHILSFSAPAGSAGVHAGAIGREAPPGGGTVFNNQLLTWMQNWTGPMAGLQAQDYLLGGSVENLPPSYNQSIGNREIRSSSNSYQSPIIPSSGIGSPGQEENQFVPQGMNRVDIRLQRDETQLESSNIIYDNVEEWATDVEEELRYLIY